MSFDPNSKNATTISGTLSCKKIIPVSKLTIFDEAIASVLPPESLKNPSQKLQKQHTVPQPQSQDKSSLKPKFSLPKMTNLSKSQIYHQTSNQNLIASPYQPIDEASSNTTINSPDLNNSFYNSGVFLRFFRPGHNL